MIDSVSDAAGAPADLKKARRKRAGFSDAAPKVDRLPPHSPEAEQGVLGCILISPNECLPQCAEKFQAGAEVFYDLRHQLIYNTLLEMHRAGEGIDLITLQQRLKNVGHLDEIGGLAYLSSLPDTVPSAANLTYYLDIVLEKYGLRRILHTCGAVSLGVYKATDFKAFIASVERDFARAIDPLGGDAMPKPVDAAEFVAAPIAEPPQVVHGVLHQGSKLVLGGSSKSFKTWSLLDLGLSVAHGSPWLQFQTTRTRVLFVNLEVQPWTIQHRLSAVASAKEIDIQPGAISILNLRGHAATYGKLLPQIKPVLKSGFGLCIIDPVYKCYGGDLDENSAGDVAGLLNALESLAVSSGAAVAFGAHFSKGNQAAKESIDRVSGSGVFARDPDTLLTLTRHETENAFTVDVTLRAFQPVDPFVVRWNYPLMRVDGDLDPDRLKKPAGRPASSTPTDLLSLIRDNPMTTGEWRAAASASQWAVGRSKFFEQLGIIRQRGLAIVGPEERWRPT